MVHHRRGSAVLAFVLSFGCAGGFKAKVGDKEVNIEDPDDAKERHERNEVHNRLVREEAERAAADEAAGRGKRKPAPDPIEAFTAWLRDAGAQLDNIELRRDAGGAVRVFAARNIAKGDPLVRLPFLRRFGGDQLAPETTRALKQLATSTLTTPASAFLAARKPEVEVALALLVEQRRLKASRRRRWLEMLPAPGALKSGLDFTDLELGCLYPDAALHVEELRRAAGAFAEVAAQACSSKPLKKLCGQPPPGDEESAWAIVLASQRARRVRPTPDSEDLEELVIFPIIDLMQPSAAGQVVPAGVFFDQQTKETTAVTFTTWRDIKKGETLHLAPQGGVSLFHVAGLWGSIETEFPSFPVQLTWSNLPTAAQRLLGESGCGEEATTLIMRNGTYPESLLKCLRIAAAFQQDPQLAEGLDYSDPERLPKDMQLAVYDLLDGVLAKTGEKAEREEGGNCTTGKPGSLLAQIAAMNNRIVATMKAAAEVMGDEADVLVAKMDQGMGSGGGGDGFGSASARMQKDAYGQRVDIPAAAQWAEEQAAPSGGSDPGEL